MLVDSATDGVCPIPPNVSQAIRHLSHWAAASHQSESPWPRPPTLTCDDKVVDPAERLERFADLTQVRGTNGEVEPSHLLESYRADLHFCDSP